MNWYDALYADDPSTDNIFGREELIPRHDPLLRAYLAHGGRLSDFVRHKHAITPPHPAPAMKQ